MPSWLKVLLVSMMPLAEMRGGLTFAREVYGFSWVASWFWAVLGNVVGLVLVIFFLHKFYALCSVKLPWTNRFFNWIFQRTRDKFTVRYEKYGITALMIMTSLPIPLLGAYTGAIAGFLFGIPPKKTFIYLFGGILLGAAIMSLILAGIFDFILLT